MWELFLTGILVIGGISAVGGLGLAYWDKWHFYGGSKGKVDKKELNQIHTDLNELKKRVDEMQEQIAELYIQQYSEKFREKMEV